MRAQTQTRGTKDARDDHDTAAQPHPMATKTIGLDQEAYERLSAAKHDDESFSEAVKRLTGEVMSEWRYGFGRFAESTEGADTFAEAVEQAREGARRGDRCQPRRDARRARDRHERASRQRS